MWEADQYQETRNLLKQIYGRLGSEADKTKTEPEMIIKCACFYTMYRYNSRKRRGHATFCRNALQVFKQLDKTSTLLIL